MPRKFRRTHTHNGVTVDLTFATAREANEWKASMVQKSLRHKRGLPDLPEERTFEDAAAEYVRFRKTTYDYWFEDEQKMRKALVPALMGLELRSITREKCELALHGARVDLGLSGATFNRYRQCLHGFFEWAREKNLVDRNPVTDVKRLAEVLRGAHIADEKVREYLELAYAHCNQPRTATWFYPLAVMGTNSGARAGELKAFRWSDYRPELRRLEIVRRYQTHLRRVKEGTKGGGGRFIPLNELVIQALDAYRMVAKFTEPDDLIFHSRSGKPISTSDITKIHRSLARRVGLPDSVRFYDITRHKYASKVTAEIGLRAAQALLGHASAATTERYAHHDPEHLINRALDVSVGGPERLH